MPQMFLHSFKSPYCRAVRFIKKKYSKCQVLICHLLGFHTGTKVWGEIIQRLHFICKQERVVFTEEFPACGRLNASDRFARWSASAGKTNIPKVWYHKRLKFEVHSVT